MSEPGDIAPHAFAAQDGRRPLFGRAVLGSLCAAAACTLFIFAYKQLRGVYVHSPWQDDPYDAVASFAVFILPSAAAACALRLPLCRASEPLPVRRVQELVRGSILIVSVALATVASDWVSLLARAERATWNGTTGLLIAGLAVLSLLTLCAGRRVRAARRALRGVPVDGGGLDWAAEVVLVLERCAPLLGPLGGAGRSIVHWVDRALLRWARRHALTTAALASLAFAVSLSLSHAVFERSGAAEFVLFCAVGFSGMFAFLVGGGAYLRVLDAAALSGVLARRALDAAFAACVAVVAALALRDLLRLPGTLAPAHASTWRLLEAIGGIGAAVFVVVLATETLARAHRRLT